MRNIAMLILAAALLPARAIANDSTAELATGGLVFTKTDSVEMQSEELFISAKEIRVVYRFLNRSDRDVTSLVAFPMPDISIEHMDQNIAIPTEDPRNILGFRTTVDGRPVPARVEQKVMARGVDQTERLRALGVPLAPHLAATNAALDRLAPDRRAEMVRLGLAEIEEYDVGKGMEKHLSARWTLRTTYYWEQTFPAGRALTVEHRYAPSVGGTVQTSLGDPANAGEEWFRHYQRKYCIEPSFLRAVERARQAAKSEYGAPFMEERIDYVLKTGANWAGPIKNFRLVVDKGAPGHLVSFCAEGVKKIGPTQFEVRKSDYTPRENIAVLILKPLPPQ